MLFEHCIRVRCTILAMRFNRESDCSPAFLEPVQ
jgi:hypothetical protein